MQEGGRAVRKKSFGTWGRGVVKNQVGKKQVLVLNCAGWARRDFGKRKKEAKQRGTRWTLGSAGRKSSPKSVKGRNKLKGEGAKAAANSICRVRKTSGISPRYKLKNGDFVRLKEIVRRDPAGQGQ